MDRDAGLLQFLQGGGELGALIRAKDWSTTPLGPSDTWPQSLKTTLGIVLNSRYPMFVFWGQQLIKIYNDGYKPILGGKHPWALGQPAREVWPEIWPAIEPLVDRALSGDPTWSDDLLLFMERNGFPEEVYFTFSYSPVPDESGGIGGMFCACTETTNEVLGERRLRTLRDLAAALAETTNEREACTHSAELLHANAADAPFVMIYLLADDGSATLAAQAGAAAGTAIVPIEIATGSEASWPVHEVIGSRSPRLVTSLHTRFTSIPPGPWPERPDSAMVLPLIDRSLDRAIGAIVLGVSARRPFDADYRGWFELVAGQVSASITSARAVEQERRRAQALADLDRAKTEFFSNVSHEFRTPLTLMLGPTEDALQSDEPALRGEALEMVHRNQLRLLKLVNSLLDFSRLEAGRSETQREATDLAAFTTNLAGVFRAAVERAGLKLTVRCETLPAPVLIDREMWEKIIFNLASNAFKFTFEGAIDVGLSSTASHVVLTVRDTGTGIPADELPRVFEKFHRVSGARGRTFEGSGIGLALVHELVTLMGGTITVESELGRGSTFTVKLPHAALSPQPDAHAAASALVPTATRSGGYLEEMLRTLPQAEVPAVTPPATRPLIVIADDNADMRGYITGLLSPTCEVVAVTDGEAALAAIRTQPVDLVLSDVMMPRMNGFELLEQLRRDPQTRTLPVILVSARAGEEETVAGLHTGADDYLVKPFGARELIARVHARLEIAAERRRREHELEASQARLRLVTDSLPALVSYVDNRQRYQFNNRAYTDWFGHSAEELHGSHLADVLGPAAYEQVRPHVEAALAGRAVRFDSVLLYKDGGPRDVHVEYVPDIHDGVTRGFYALITDHSARHRAEQALRDADRRKDEFLAMLAHELRSPLAPIRSAAEVLRMGEALAAPQQWAREVIERQTQHLTRLVDDQLDVSRITRGMVTIRREPVALDKVIHRSVETSRPMIDARHQLLSVTVPDQPIYVEGDLTRLVQVVANLLNNAAKYTEDNGRIWIAVHEADGMAEISVRDNGIGLSSELLPHIFDLFTQATRSLDRSQGGLGIGLTLVRHLVQLHGGTVGARSGGPGQGSEFIVRLPAISADDRADAGPANETRPATTGSRRNVLVVEDHSDSADMMAFLIAAAGHTVHKAADGTSALAIALATRPDVIVCDIGLPGMNGYELAAQIRRRPELRSVQLIAVSGYGRAEDRKRAEDAGFDAHLTKPVEPARLHSLLELGVDRA